MLPSWSYFDFCLYYRWKKNLYCQHILWMISLWWNTTMNVFCSWSGNHSNGLEWYYLEKSLIWTNAEINNSQSTISDNRTQPQISGAFLFLTKFRNSVYFLNIYCLFQKYTIPCRFILHKEKNGKISPMQIYNGGNIFKYFFLWSPELSFFKKINLNSSLHGAVASLTY